MIVLGIDPGIAIVGYGIIDYIGNKFKVLDYGVIRTKSDLSYPERLELIFNELNQIISSYNIDEIAVEELFFCKNVKTAIDVAHARGVIVLCGQLNKKPIYEYTPLQVKQGVSGYGKADKRQVQEMVKLLLNLKTIPKPDDAADALAIAISHCHTSKITGMFRA